MNMVRQLIPSLHPACKISKRHLLRLTTLPETALQILQ